MVRKQDLYRRQEFTDQWDPRANWQACSTPLTDLSSGNLVLQVTLYTSLKLHGRTAELLRPDFNRQVIRFTRHALQFFNFDKSEGLMIRDRNHQSL